MKQAATLTEIAYWSRETIKYAIAFLIFLVVTRLAWTAGFSVYRSFYPEPPPAPTVLFGKLPTLAFSTAQQLESALMYTLELPEGELPTTTTTLPIYVTQARRAHLGALDQARLTARRLQFTGKEEPVSQTIYRFYSDKTDAVLEMNIITGTFSINSNLHNDSELLGLRPPPQDKAVQTVRSYLTNANLLPEDFKQGEVAAIFAKSENQSLVPVVSLSEGQFVRIDLFRQQYHDLPVVTAYPNRANVWFILSGETDERQIIGGEFHYFKVDQSTNSTYPLKNSQEAWEDLKSGRGAIISLPGDLQVVVRRVYLAYYDPGDYQEFFQPVFVFEGDNGFLGYVPAVANEYYGR